MVSRQPQEDPEDSDQLEFVPDTPSDEVISKASRAPNDPNEVLLGDDDIDDDDVDGDGDFDLDDILYDEEED